MISWRISPSLKQLDEWIKHFISIDSYLLQVQSSHFRNNYPEVIENLMLHADLIIIYSINKTLHLCLEVLVEMIHIKFFLEFILWYFKQLLHRCWFRLSGMVEFLMVRMRCVWSGMTNWRWDGFRNEEEWCVTSNFIVRLQQNLCVA